MMNKPIKLLALAALVAVMAFSGCSKTDPVAPSTTQKIVQYTAGDYIVAFKTNFSDVIQSVDGFNGRIESVISKYGIESNAVFAKYFYVLKGFAVTLTADQAQKLAADPDIKAIEKDRTVSLPPDEMKPVVSKSQNEMLAQTTPWGITFVGGALINTTFTRKAWIIDTGIDLDHPDLTVNTNLSRTFVTSGQDSRSADDNNGHGSHVSGTIAAKNNLVGVIGVAPGATLVAVKVLNSQGSGQYSWVINGVNYVASAAASGDVANMSLGGPHSSLLDQAVSDCAARGIRFAIAAGNDGTNVGTSSPADVNATNVYTVAACDNTPSWASWSNYGSAVDYCAPGVSIYSTYKNKTYATLSGTSMATPHVAGILVAMGAVSSNGTITCPGDNNSYPLAHR